MNRFSEDLSLTFKDNSQLSFKDFGTDDIELFLDGESVGMVEVWTDAENGKREYIIINYEMVYLDSIEKL